MRKKKKENIQSSVKKKKKMLRKTFCLLHLPEIAKRRGSISDGNKSDREKKDLTAVRSSKVRKRRKRGNNEGARSPISRKEK